MTAHAAEPIHDPMTAEMSFTANTLDRQAVQRSDTAYLQDLLEGPAARIVLSTPTKLILPDNTGETIGHQLDAALAVGADRREMVFLGVEPSTAKPYFATTIDRDDDEIAAMPGLKVIDLRTLALRAELPPSDLGILAQARALIHWHRTHRFCSRCGQPSKMAEGGYRRDCGSCGGHHFPRTDPCVIMLITDGERALLGRPPRLPEGIFTTLAGFMEPGETIEDAVRRETLEESGIRVGKVTLISDQPWPFPANLMLGCLGEALSFDIDIEDDELEACRWCDRAEVRQMIDGTHPDGDIIPPSISIAHHLITGWLERRL